MNSGPRRAVGTITTQDQSLTSKPQLNLAHGVDFSFNI